MRKKRICVFALSALALVGCQKNDLNDVLRGGGGTIKYTVALGQSSKSSSEGTKGTLINTSGSDKNLQDYFDSFIAEAYDGSDNKKVDQTVTWNGTSNAWVGAPVAYWPQATNLSFLAYANLPGTQTATITATGVSTVHTVPEAVTDQTDILFGHYQGNGGSNGTAEIRFDHPLTAVRFVQGNMTNIEVKSIEISGIPQTGTATMTPAGVISWSSLGAYTWTVSQNISTQPASAGELFGEPFIIIPQNLAANNVTITVKITGGKNIKAVLKTGEWKAGYTNTYQLYLEPDLTLGVKEWVDGSQNVSF